VEKAIKENRNKKARGDGDVHGNVLKLLGEGGLKIKTKLINTIDETGEWPKDFTEVTMIALKKKPKLQNAATIAHSALSHIKAKILRRWIKRKIVDVLGEDQFGFRRGKGTRDVTGMLRIISERTLEVDVEMRGCIIDWQKASDLANWTKLTQILKRTGTYWSKRRLISNLYMAQSVNP
jgi:hypothetical protein